MRPGIRLAILGAAALVACAGGGALKEPKSDSQFDDPDDPGAGGDNGGAVAPADAGAQVVALPDGAPGIGFDDLRFSAALGRILVPAGRAGDVDLVDPSSLVVSAIGGFATAAQYTGGHSDGATSADEGGGIVYAIDRTAMRLDVVDPKARAIVSYAPLAAAPDYVRYVAATREIWVTEPGKQQIEIFSIGAAPTTPPAHAATIAVGGGPESLEIDVVGKQQRAYTHSLASVTYQIDVAARAVTATWPNGCTGSRGIAVDGAHGWVVAACAEGRVVVLDANNAGATLGTADVGAGVDQIAYDAQRARLYVPGSIAATVSVVDLGAGGKPVKRGQLAATSGTHCVATSGGGAVFVCDPARGGLLALRDVY